MEFRCPHCQAPIYSRKRDICGVCEKPLPKELLLSDEQADTLKQQEAQHEKRVNEFYQQLNDVSDHSHDGA